MESWGRLAPVDELYSLSVGPDWADSGEKGELRRLVDGYHSTVKMEGPLHWPAKAMLGAAPLAVVLAGIACPSIASYVHGRFRTSCQDCWW